MLRVMRFVSRLVLFVLVIAVSGVGAAQAQTDPDSAPPSIDQEELRDPVSEGSKATRVTPDLVAKSARLYETDEQIIRNSDDVSEANYWFALDWTSGDSAVYDNTIWYFYKVDGYDGFFIEVVGTAGMFETNAAIGTYEPYIDARYSNALRDSSDPSVSISLNTGATTTFRVDYTPPGGIGPTVGITTEVPEEEAVLNPRPLNKWYSVELENKTTIAATAPNLNRAFSNKFVSYWSGEPWGIYVGACGQYVVPELGRGRVDVYDWGEPRREACYRGP